MFRLFDSKTLKGIRVLQTDAVTSVKFNPLNSNYFIVCTSTGSCKMYNASTGAIVDTIIAASKKSEGFLFFFPFFLFFSFFAFYIRNHFVCV
jgi:WD40 repeat protein